MADESVSADLPSHRPDGGTCRSGRGRAVPGARRRRGLRAAAWAAAGAVLLGGVGLGVLYARLNGNLRGVDINAALGTDRPEDVDNGSLDLLVLGSDSRAGKNGAYGPGGDGARSDTAMVVHVHEGHRKATVVSIPRDTLVARPACERGGGRGTAPAVPRAMFNDAYQVGGPACAVKTVESISGIRMDHYLEVDFTGFKRLVDELGGVDVTVGETIEDPKSHLDLPPGTHTLDGEQSLGLVRTRHSVGDGSDLGRIQLQHAFLEALGRRVREIGLFGDPARLYRFSDTATRTVTTDSELDSVDALLALIKSLRDIDSRGMALVTLPVVYDAADPNRVLPLERQSRRVWKALREDRPVPASAIEDSAGEEAGADDVVTGS